MLSVLVLGTGVICLSLLVGCLLPRSQQLRAGDQLVVTAWVGLLVSSTSLLGLSLIMPLGNGAAAGIFTLVGLASILRRSTRAALRDWIQAAGRGGLVTGILLMIGLAVLASAARPMGGDYGGYHYPLTLWFTEVGAVPGLGLLHHRFATPASWWTINALYNVGHIQGRVEPMLGYVSVVLLSCHVVVAMARILKGRAALSDWFLAVGFALMLPYLSGMLGYPDKPFSDRADEAVAMLGLLVAWLFLALSQPRTARNYGHQAPDRGSLIALLIIAAGAVTLKLSALPILAVAWLFTISVAKRPVRTAALSAAVVVLVLSPLMLFSLTTTGCILFPSDIGCLNLPWAIGADRAKWYSSTVTNVARWMAEEPQGTFSEWLRGWFSGRPLLATTSLASILGGGIHLSVSMRRRGRIPPWGWPVMLGVSGLTYGMVLAPTLRFLIPYLMIVPSLVLVWAIHRTRIPARTGVLRRVDQYTYLPFAVPALVLVTLFALPTTVLNVRSAVRGNLGEAILLEEVRWLVPDAIPSDPSLEVRWSADVRYLFPVETSQCGGAPLPCTPFLTYPDIRLRSPDKGLAGGFVRSAVSTPNAN